jgi:hypothetical protein
MDRMNGEVNQSKAIKEAAVFSEDVEPTIGAVMIFVHAFI